MGNTLDSDSEDYCKPSDTEDEQGEQQLEQDPQPGTSRQLKREPPRRTNVLFHRSYPNALTPAIIKSYNMHMVYVDNHNQMVNS